MVSTNRKIDVAFDEEAMHEQSGSGEQHKRESHLTRNESIAQAAASKVSVTAAASLYGFIGMPLRDSQRRRQAEY